MINEYSIIRVGFSELYRVRRKDSKGRELRYMPIDDSRHIVNVLHILYGRRNFENII